MRNLQVTKRSLCSIILTNVREGQFAHRPPCGCQLSPALAELTVFISPVEAYCRRTGFFRLSIRLHQAKLLHDDGASIIIFCSGITLPEDL